MLRENLTSGEKSIAQVKPKLVQMVENEENQLEKNSALGKILKHCHYKDVRKLHFGKTSHLQKM